MIEVVCGIIRNERGEILMCRRPVGKHLGGLWEFPGGKVEAGEDFRQTLVRELREELVVTVVIGDSLQPVEWNYETGSIRLWPFLCEISEGKPAAIEHDELKWCALGEIFSLQLAPADRPVLEELWQNFG